MFILRGVSGSGKSTVAAAIASTDPDSVICCADDFFEDDDGNYKFNSAYLKEAHEDCFKKCCKAIWDRKSTIIIANTNTTAKEWARYEEAANLNGYKVFFLVVENRHGNSDIHGVPRETKQKQAERVKQSLKL